MQVLLLWISCLTWPTAQAALETPPWARHTIDDSSRGADGVRVADVDGDGWPDLCTGWEEGGNVRVYRHPGRERVRKPWPRVVVGRAPSPEDAVFCDLDGDGAIDVVSCCEGRTRSVFFHWAPKSPDRYFDGSMWSPQAVPVTAGRQAWMFALPWPRPDTGGLELIVGAKGSRATVSRLYPTDDPRQLDRWKLQPLYQAGWIMSLAAADLDGDGDQDVVVSDRKGPRRGVLWIENPPAERRELPWPVHRVGGETHEVMFLTLADLDQDGQQEIVCATRNQEILVFHRRSVDGRSWERRAVPNPGGVRHGKAVAVGDINLDGIADLVHTTNTGGDRSQPGVTWMQRQRTSSGEVWRMHDISGTRGVKFDLIQLLDLDADGDLDVVTCEERDNLGVFWYENPIRRPPAHR